MGNTNDFNVAEQRYIDNSDKYITATLAMASANLLFSKNVELNVKMLDIQSSKVSIWQKIGGYLAKMKGGFGDMSAEQIAQMEKDFKIINIEDEMKANTKATKEFFDEYEKNSKNLNMPNFFGGDEEGKTNKTNQYNKNSIKELIQSEYELSKIRLERQKAEAK